jgi:hypothetical protein
VKDRLIFSLFFALSPHPNPLPEGEGTTFSSACWGEAKRSPRTPALKFQEPAKRRQTKHNELTFCNHESCRPLRGLGLPYWERSWGLRPRLYADVRSADFIAQKRLAESASLIRMQLNPV